MNRRGYLDQIRHGGAPLSRELAAAFAAVPREAFVPEGFQRRDGTWALPADPDFLATVYSDDVLVTKMDGHVPTSSSSQPSLMATMLEALDVRAGQRILEIGAGTGYNAALMAALGATVTSVDVQPDVADRARAALARAGAAGVQVLHGDGYAGRPGELFDRIIVTVGIAGISPLWLDQLAPGGRVIAPVEHAGTHPVLDIRPAPACSPAAPDVSEVSPRARVVCAAGFMTAAGALAAEHAGSFARPVGFGVLTDLTVRAPARFAPALEPGIYRNLWYAAGIWDKRITHAVIDENRPSYIALLDGGRAAVIRPDGEVLANTDPGAAVEIMDRWERAGRPPMKAWEIGLSPAGDPDAPIWVPSRYQLPDRRSRHGRPSGS